MHLKLATKPRRKWERKKDQGLKKRLNQHNEVAMEACLRSSSNVSDPFGHYHRTMQLFCPWKASSKVIVEVALNRKPDKYPQHTFEKKKNVSKSNRAESQKAGKLFIDKGANNSVM